MVVLSIICGIILIIGGVCCIFTPAATLISAGYIMMILLLVFGIVGIVNVVRKEADPVTLVAAIPAIIIGIIAIFRPGSTLVFDGIMVYLFAAWFIVDGAVSIYVSVSARKTSSGWGLGVFLGILGIVLGILAIFNPMISVIGISLLIGFFLIQVGLDLIVMSTAVNSGE